MRNLITLFLEHFNFYLSAGLLVTLIVLVWLNRRWWLGSVLPKSRTAALSLLGLFLVGLLVRLLAVPHLHHVLDDEFGHVVIAEAMAFHHRFSLCPEGPGPCLPQWMPIFHLLIGAVYLFSGISETAVFVLNCTIGSLTILLFFTAAKAAAGTDRAGLLAAALLTCYPLHLKFCGGGNSEPTALFFVALTVTALFVHIREDKAATALLALVAVTTAALVRIEHGILMAPVFGIVGWRALHWPREWKRTAILASVVGLSLLMLGEALVSYKLYAYWRNDIVVRPLSSAWQFLFFNGLNPLPLPLLAAASVVLLWRENRWLPLAAISCWVAYLLTYTALHGLDINRGDFHRYHINVALFQLGLAALVVNRLLGMRFVWARLTVVAIGLWLALTIWQSWGLVQSPYRSDGEYAEIAWARSVSEELPEEAVIYGNRTFMLSVVTGGRFIDFRQPPRPGAPVFLYVSGVVEPAGEDLETHSRQLPHGLTVEEEPVQRRAFETKSHNWTSALYRVLPEDSN